MAAEKHFATALFALLLTAGSMAQSASEKLSLIAEKIYPPGSPGAVLFVSKGRKILLNKGFGIADLETGEKISPDTHFRMASVSKQFTAMCILQLLKQKKLELEDPVVKYLPALPAFACKVTIRNLMTHTSGIADYEPLVPEGQKEQIFDADVLRLISRTDSLYFTPGEQFRYSNSGYCLLTQVVEKASGLPYSGFIKAHIFIPQGMKHSLIYQKNQEIFKRAYGYHREAEGWNFADQSVTSATMGDGAVYTSLNEYRKWIRYLWKQKFPGSLQNPLSPHMAIKKGLDYGYGWFIAQQSNGSTAYFHSGESTGFHNIVYHNPQEKLLVVLFSNSDDGRAAQAFNEIMATLNIQLKELPEGLALFDFLSGIYTE